MENPFHQRWKRNFGQIYKTSCTTVQVIRPYQDWRNCIETKSWVILNGRITMRERLGSWWNVVCGYWMHLDLSNSRLGRHRCQWSDALALVWWSPTECHSHSIVLRESIWANRMLFPLKSTSRETSLSAPHWASSLENELFGRKSQYNLWRLGTS